jgi:hypothetical protein
MDPQLIEVIAVVQAVFEYTPTFGPAMIVPEDDMPWLTVMVAIAKPDRAIAETAKTIIKLNNFLCIILHHHSIRAHTRL